MNTKYLLLPVLLAVALPGCKEIEPDPEPPTEEVFRGVPVPPRSVLMSQTGTENAAQMDIFTPLAVDSAAAWYREILFDRGWRIEGDMANPDGGHTIHARRDGPPLWLMLKPIQTSVYQGTRLTIIGALPDSSGTPETTAESAN